MKPHGWHGGVDGLYTEADTPWTECRSKRTLPASGTSEEYLAAYSGTV
jgi:hypothetical protein